MVLIIGLGMGLITRTVGRMARRMWTRGTNVEEDDEMKDALTLTLISLDETKENKKSKTKAGFHLKAY